MEKKLSIIVEERSDYRNNIHCPFCGKLVADVESGEDVIPCEHTLFIAHDEGFEFCDTRTKENLGMHPDQDLDDYLENSEIFQFFSFSISFLFFERKNERTIKG